MKNTQKGFIIPILIAIIAILVIGGGYYIYQLKKTAPTSPAISDDNEQSLRTDDWVSYSDNTLGVELKHPSDWMAYTAPLVGANVIVLPKSSPIGLSAMQGSFYIVVSHEEGNSEAVLADSSSGYYSQFKKNIDRDITLDGRKTIHLEILETSLDTRVETFIIDSGIGSYKISYFVTKTDNGIMYEQVAKTIVKNMHFDTNTLVKDPWVSKNKTILNLFDHVYNINSGASIMYGAQKSYKQVCSGNMVNFSLIGGQTDFNGTTFLKPYGKSCVSSEESFAADFIINNRTVCTSLHGRLDDNKQYVGYGHIDPVNKICIRE